MVPKHVLRKGGMKKLGLGGIAGHGWLGSGWLALAGWPWLVGEEVGERSLKL